MTIEERIVKKPIIVPVAGHTLTEVRSLLKSGKAHVARPPWSLAYVRVTESDEIVAYVAPK